MTIRDVVNIGSSLVVAVAATTMVGVYLHDRANPGGPPKYVENWEDWQEVGIRIGPQEAPMVIAAFMDFTCPFCRSLAPVLDSVMDALPGQVTVQFHHFPLSNHEFGMASAIAAECAERQGRFAEMYGALFAEMDSIGAKPWEEYATAAGIPDRGRFSRCINEPPASFTRIASGRMLGEEIGVVGTPSVWVNGRELVARSVDEFMEQARELGITSPGAK